jgi:hypothetical protein
MQEITKFMFCRETWAGDSRDGKFINGEGYHYFKMSEEGEVLDAFEYYETEEGQEVVTKVPEMKGVHWLKDLGFEDFETLEMIAEHQFDHIKELLQGR